MKVLFLTNQLNVGGVEKNIVRITRELSSRNHSVWAATSGGDLVDEFATAGGRHIDLLMTPRPRAFIRDVSALIRFVRQHRPDIVHVFSASAATLWAAASTATRVVGMSPPGAVGSVMGLQSSPEEKGIVTSLRVFATSIGVRKLIVMAPAIAEVVHRLPIAKRRLVYMSVVGVDVPPDPALLLARRAEVREELGVTSDDPVVMTVGNLEPRKSHELFVRAAAAVLATGRRTRFFIVGEGARRPYLEAEIERLGVSSSVTLLGSRQDATRLLVASDIYVRPGIVEGFIGITVMEAQALGLPVVSFELEDVKLAITDRVSGCLVPRGDSNALAATIVELLDDPALRESIGAGGRSQVRQLFGIPAIVDRLEDLYRSEAGDRRRDRAERETGMRR